MLMPKKVKYRKQQKGKMRGKAWRGSELAFGDFGLKVVECGYITDRQIEAVRLDHQPLSGRREAYQQFPESDDRSRHRSAIARASRRRRRGSGR